MRIAVTGLAGQVALALQRGADAAGVEVVAVGRPQLDLARPETVAAALASTGADLVISAAAYTAVDQAEDEPELADTVNRAGAGAVASAAAAMGCPVIHLSTDYVFAGIGAAPHAETDPTGPQGAYGASKLAGEYDVASANPRHLILRTAWVYSPWGRNFVKTMLRLARDRDEIAVVADQWGNPTSALDIAEALFIASRKILRGGPVNWGTYHLAGSGQANWAGVAREALEASRVRGGAWARVRDIATADYPTKARRPANSRLSTEKFADEFRWQAPAWPGSVERVVDIILKAERDASGSA